MRIKSIIVLFTVFLFSACKKEVKIEGFDNEAWKKDPSGCSGVRKSSLDYLKTQKEQLVGLREQQVVQLLGRPDIKDLYKRGQKMFIYFIDDKNPKCDTSFVGSPSLLRIRFSAIELSNEAIFEEP